MHVINWSDVDIFIESILIEIFRVAENVTCYILLWSILVRLLYLDNCICRFPLLSIYLKAHYLCSLNGEKNRGQTLSGSIQL